MNLVNLINPELYYPVPYTVKHDGTKVPGMSALLGKYLTENHIKWLYEGGYIATPTQHKTLAECKDEVARIRAYKDWQEMYEREIRMNTGAWTFLLKCTEEAAELYAIQFIKKDDELSSAEKIQAIYNEMPESRLKDHLAKWFSLEKEVVSSDVVEDFKRFIKFLCGETDFDGVWFGEYNGQSPFWWRTKLREFENIFQSTQQPAIEWLTEEEIRSVATKHSVIYLAKFGAAYDAINELQDKLKERVNCVDPWISVNDRLPELEQEVLSFSINEGIRQTKYTTYQEGSTGHSQGDTDCWFEWATHNNFAWKHRATHWMPLLNSPKTNPNGQAE